MKIISKFNKINSSGYSSQRSFRNSEGNVVIDDFKSSEYSESVTMTRIEDRLSKLDSDSVNNSVANYNQV